VDHIAALSIKSWRQAANASLVLRQQSVLKCLVIFAFAAALEVGLFLLFRDGLRFLDNFGGVGSLIIRRLFSVFFLGMSGMLAMSGLATSYMTLYRSGEVPFLLTGPVPAADVAVYKFLQSTVLSSWAFFFIITPFVAAFAVHQRLSILFAVWTLLFSAPFLLVCSGAGTLASMCAVRWCPRGRGVKWALGVAAAAAVAAGWLYLRSVYRPVDEATFDLARLVPGFRLAAHPLLPGWWMSEGILAVSRGRYGTGAMFWLLLAASGALVTVLVERLAAFTYMASLQRVWVGGERAGRPEVLMPWLDRALGAALPADVRALVGKDVRVFLRDPMQWSQTLVFFGLLAIYFANLRAFRYNALPGEWRHIITFLNVFSVSAVMCSLGARFMFPQLSLEGQGFWILGLSPTTMRRILLTKFTLAAVALVAVSVPLMVLSSSMLNAPAAAQLTSVVLVAAVSVATAGLSCGLGAVFVDLRQTNPAAIVSGFGGTLNLVCSLAYMLAGILPFGLLFHLDVTGALPAAQRAVALGLAWAWLGGLTAVATVIPLRMGIRALERRDY
jgi:ABC-2 type transport system permease protein